MNLLANAEWCRDVGEFGYCEIHLGCTRNATHCCCLPIYPGSKNTAYYFFTSHLYEYFSKQWKATYDTRQIKCQIFKAIRPFVKTTQKLHKLHTKNTYKLKHYTKLKHYIYKKGLLEFKSTFSVVNFNTHLIIVKAIERINKRPLTHGLGRIARGAKGEMQTRIIQKQ